MSPKLEIEEKVLVCENCCKLKSICTDPTKCDTVPEIYEGG